jgi:hypothetical protein
MTLRGPGESYSEVILRLVEISADCLWAFGDAVEICIWGEATAPPAWVGRSASYPTLKHSNDQPMFSGQLAITRLKHLSRGRSTSQPVHRLKLALILPR